MKILTDKPCQWSKTGVNTDKRVSSEPSLGIENDHHHRLESYEPELPVQLVVPYTSTPVRPHFCGERTD